jgi:hypothetical protein
VDSLTFLNKDLCDCNSRDPQNICLRTVICRSTSTLTVFKSKQVTEAENWNIAQAGQYQRKSALEPVKRVRHLVLGFSTPDGTFNGPLRGLTWETYERGYGRSISV